MDNRRRVTLEQLEMLFEFLNSHKDIAVGYNKSTQARAHSRSMWKNCATLLNSTGEGAYKDWKGWAKYWIDFKSKLKKRQQNSRKSASRTGGGPSKEQPLTDLEEKFLQILGKDYGCGLPGIQVDPFGSDGSQERRREDQGSLTLNSEDSPMLIVVGDQQEALDSLILPFHQRNNGASSTSPNQPGCSQVLPTRHSQSPNQRSRSPSLNDALDVGDSQHRPARRLPHSPDSDDEKGQARTEVAEKHSSRALPPRRPLRRPGLRRATRSLPPEAPPPDATSQLMLSYAGSLRRLAPRRAARLKLQLARLFAQAELEQLDEMDPPTRDRDPLVRGPKPAIDPLTVECDYNMKVELEADTF